MVPHAGVALKHRIRANSAFFANGNSTQHQLAALYAGVLEIHARTNAYAISYADQRRHTHQQRARLHIAPHFYANSAQVQVQQNRAIEHIQRRGIAQPV